MISVIIPVYNVEKYIKECLDSVLCQTYEDFELLLINDGSSDNSGQICEEYALKDNRIIVIHKQNSGVSATRNLGLEKAKGEFVAFIDSDDVVSPDYLEKLYRGILEGDGDVCLCRYSRMYDNRVVPIEERYLKTYINDKGMDEYFDCFLSHYITPLCKDELSYLAGTSWRMLFRKSSFPFRFQEDVSVSEDFLFVLRNFPCIRRINVVEEALYFYRANNTSAMSNYRKNFLVNEQAYLQEFEDILRDLGLSDKKRIEEVLIAQKALCSAFLFGNEIRFRKQAGDFKGNIDRLKNNELYAYLTLRNSLRIKHKSMKIKYLGVWFLVKTKIYKIL